MINVSFDHTKSYTSDGIVTFHFSGVIHIQGKESSVFIFELHKSNNCFRIQFQMKPDEESPFEDVNGNTSVRFKTIPNPLNNGLRSRKVHQDVTLLHLDQLHILKKFQRKQCGTKLLALLFIWVKYTFSDVKKCIVVSPSSIGKPFYLALGATQQISSSNLMFLL